MPCVEIMAKKTVLVGRGFTWALFSDEIVVPFQDACTVFRRFEFANENACRNAGGAAVAGWTIDNGLRPPEAAFGQDVVEWSGALSLQIGEYLSLLAAFEVRARGGQGEIKLRVVPGMPGHLRLPGVSFSTCDAKF